MHCKFIDNYMKIEDLSNMRQDYTVGDLREQMVQSDPLDQFKLWMEKAIELDIVEPNAMIIATSTVAGKPSARTVLLKEVNKNGFVFFTNYNSRKGRELSANPFASVVFDWHAIARQVRIEGRVEKISESDSDDYFNSRPESSKIGAWVSPQSQVIRERAELELMQVEYEKQFEGRTIHRPPFWGGFLIRPDVIEFWQGRPNRLHDRIVYYKTEDGWTIHRLAP
jgi:pyridoxamine 5'-phosphate oxidase